jgi:DNA-directed RNA polymerase subunit RPC12/RpoP
MICPDCDELMVRSRRTLTERLWAKAAYNCSSCGRRNRVRWLREWRITAYVRCPECESPNVRCLHRTDPIDRVNRNPLRHLQRLFKAQLYRCGSCRLQFYDSRSLKQPHSSLNAAR